VKEKCWNWNVEIELLECWNVDRENKQDRTSAIVNPSERKQTLIKNNIWTILTFFRKTSLTNCFSFIKIVWASKTAKMFVPIKIETRPFYWIVVGLQFVLKEFLGFLGIVKQTTKCTFYDR
jgi:hypothetical protein